MIEINGSVGGGQVLRTALGFSCLLKKPFHMKNIRITRPNPGLQEQHLQCILALAKLADAEIKNVHKGSKEIYFSPKQIKHTFLDINISTAGSVGLVLQSLLIVGFKYPLKVRISGGATYGKWAPSIDFIDKVFCFWLRKFGMDVKIKVLKHGFYPKGGAEVELKVLPTTKKENIFIETIGKIKKVNVIAVSSLNLKNRNVLERMISVIKRELSDIAFIDVNMDYTQTLCSGCGITLYAETEDAVVGNSLCGEVGKTAEEVAKEISRIFLEDIKEDALDRYTSDQILPYLAFLGGKIKIAGFSDHVESNIKVVEKFLEIKINKDYDKKFVYI